MPLLCVINWASMETHLLHKGASLDKVCQYNYIVVYVYKCNIVVISLSLASTYDTYCCSLSLLFFSFGWMRCSVQALRIISSACPASAWGQHTAVTMVGCWSCCQRKTYCITTNTPLLIRLELAGIKHFRTTLHSDMAVHTEGPQVILL